VSTSSRLRSLGSDTAVYGISTIIGRFLNFLLVPFYTNVLVPGEYGIVANVYSWIAFFNVIYGYGMESAYFAYATSGEIGTERENFSTPLITLIVSSVLFSGALLLWSGPVSHVLGVGAGLSMVIPATAGILLLDTVAVIPFASLRLERRAKYFGAVKVLNIVVNVAANLVFLLVLHAGVEGIFLSGLLASGVTILALIPAMKGKVSLDFSRPLFAALLRFGLPYIPAGLAAMAIQVIDRPIMKALTDDATVGVYQANYRLGIFMMLLVSMFDFAWRPFFLTHAKDPDAKSLFSRVLTFFVAGALGVWLTLSLFIGDIVQWSFFGRTLIHRSYWGGLSVVPVVLMGYLFLGMYNNLVAGIYIEKRTGKLPWITGVGGGVNILLNVTLIPVMGMMGAAIATLAAYAAMAAAMALTVRTLYPVPYEWAKILKAFLAAGAAYAATVYFLPDQSSVFLRALGVPAFALLLWVFGVITKEESKRIAGFIVPR
jgi:O-antigen/teichoic acid export membrane protein